MGLGLTVCRTIVTAHGGELRASSNPEGGATFQFTVPVAAARPILKAAEERVFLVDDDPAVLKALARLLRSAGIEAVTFGSPEEFLERVAGTDAGMRRPRPGHAGARRAGAPAGHGGARTGAADAFLTGHGDIPQSVQAMKKGAVDFLTKPVDDAVFLRAVREALARGRAGRADREESARIHRRLETLTPREREVLDGVVSGQLNKQIAGDLGIAVKTVKVHRGRVMEKMGAQSVAELVRMADRAGLRRA